MKKIIFYIDSMQRGGAQRVIANLCNYFVIKGYQVILINDIVPDTQVPQHVVEHSVVRIYLDSYSTHKTNKIIKNFSRIVNLRQILKEECPVCAISFLGPPNVRMLIAGIGLCIRKIVSVRNDPYREYGQGIKKLLSNVLFLLADGVVFQTEDASKYFSEKIRNKSTIIFNPISTKFYIEGLHDSKSILFVGRLMEQKNPEILIKAFSKIAQKYEDYNLIFIGDGPLKDKLKLLVELYDLSKRVEFYGTVENVEDYLSRGSIFVLTSNYEGLPNALMEAMAAGLAVISTDCPCGGPRLLINNETQGKLIPCNNEIALINALDEILRDELRIRSMGTNAKIRARDFKPEIIFNQWESYILNSKK